MTTSAILEVPTASHPLLDVTIVDQPRSFAELRAAFNESLNLVELLWLLDTAPSAKVPSYYDQSRLFWLLDLADHWSDTSFFGGRNGMNQQIVACKALSVAVNCFLYKIEKPVEIDWFLLTTPGVLEKLAWFFRAENHLHIVRNLQGDLLWNVAPSRLGRANGLWPNEEMIAVPGRLREFARALWKASWDLPRSNDPVWKGRRYLQSPGKPTVDLGPSISPVDEARPTLLHLGDHFGELELLATKDYWPDQLCKDLLRQWAMETLIPDSGGRLASSPIEAAAHGSEAAKVLLVVDPIDDYRKSSRNVPTPVN